MSIKVHSIYDSFFSKVGVTPGSWEGFKSYKVERCEPDFSISTSQPSTCREIAIKVIKALILPWLFYRVFKYLIGQFAMYHMYAAQRYSKSQINLLRDRIAKNLSMPWNQHIIGREVALNRNGVCYSGLLVGHKSNISNGKWAIYAPGRDTTIEHAYLNGCAEPYIGAGYSVLMLNGPNVGNSGGTATPETLGEAQELGITFLETALKAKKIVLCGHSLGAASLSKAIKTHTFKNGVDYFVIRIMTFCKLSRVTRKLAGSFASHMVHWLGYEINQMEASTVLKDQNISEVIFEGGKDAMMAGSRLGEGLRRKNLINGKVIYMPDSEHSELPFDKIRQEILAWDLSSN